MVKGAAHLIPILFLMGKLVKDHRVNKQAFRHCAVLHGIEVIDVILFIFFLVHLDLSS